MGNPLIDPQHTTDYYSQIFYNLGFASEAEANFIKNKTDIAIKFTEQGKYIEAAKIIDELIGFQLDKPSYFQYITNVDLTNFMRAKQPSDGDIKLFVNRAETRKFIHVGDTSFENGCKDVKEALYGDIMVSQAANLSALLDNEYKVLIYNGQLDLIIGASMTEHSLKYLMWKGKDDYLKAKRHIWKVDPSDDDVAGYVTTVGRFQRVIVLGGGHNLAHDQPVRTLNMTENFIKLN